MVISSGHLEEPGWLLDMGVSKNNGTPKWVIYKGKPY